MEHQQARRLLSFVLRGDLNQVSDLPIWDRHPHGSFLLQLLLMPSFQRRLQILLLRSRSLFIPHVNQHLYVFLRVTC